MDITYLGHSCFKLRGKSASVVTDPYDTTVGLSLPRVSADLVTVSHAHGDHSEADKISGTARRKDPYVIQAPGEYEVEDVSVFGWSSFHDNVKGEERGRNVIYVIHIDDIRVCHLGDLGHELEDSLVDDLGKVDVLMVPVGGVYTIDASTATKVVGQLQPGIVIPMHFRTKQHDQKLFGQLQTVDEFLQAMESDKIEPVNKLSLNPGDIPEETEIVVLEP